MSDASEHRLLTSFPHPEQVSAALRQQIAGLRFPLSPVSVGTVTYVGDGTAKISGLHDVMVGELLEFEDETLGMAMNLEREEVGAIVLGSDRTIHQGSTVHALGEIAAVPVGDELLGRVVDALGRPIDSGGPIRTTRARLVESSAPAIIERQPIRVPLHTGIKAVDALVPIGRGQRELIIGDRQTGKTTLAVDAMLNQQAGDVICIYVAIGQRLSNVAQVVRTLERHGVMRHSVVVTADAGAPAALQYLAPYAGCAIGQEFMEHGHDVLIVYDDLTKHAWAYRQISLLLRRPPGREAFPGDIFYLHARLLERAGRLSAGGSMTALPIIETQMGDLAAYIPTNVISITDGQIFLEEDLFHAGVRPAVNAGLSVSRVAGAAQTPAMKQVSGQLRLAMAQYRELASFAQFGAELDSATQAALDRGTRILELLKQDQHDPRPLEEQIALLFAVNRGFLDDIPIDQIRSFERQFLDFLRERQGLRNAITIVASSRTLGAAQGITPELEALLTESLHEFVSHYLLLD
jgi:F-type H+/Na+-transporting ATPase subunit alpha